VKIKNRFCQYDKYFNAKHFLSEINFMREELILLDYLAYMSLERGMGGGWGGA
jgi:hypothetical protein